jgi:septum formation protein
LLAAAGLTFSVVPSSVDESLLKQRLLGASPAALATALAIAKAESVAALMPGKLVIGADQILELDGRTFDKPASLAEARRQLTTLRGRTHVLHSAVALVFDNGALWSTVASARLNMRAFSDAFLDAYLARAGDRVLSSVGAYEIEGLGIQLFEAVDGDHATILGLPMLPLLAELRRHGVAET